MTSAEKDAQARALRERRREARETVAAILSELWGYRDRCADLVALIDGIRRDAAMRLMGHSIPDALPSPGRLRQLLEELRENMETIARADHLLAQLGYEDVGARS